MATLLQQKTNRLIPREIYKCGSGLPRCDKQEGRSPSCPTLEVDANLVSVARQKPIPFFIGIGFLLLLPIFAIHSYPFKNHPLWLHTYSGLPRHRLCITIVASDLLGDSLPFLGLS